MSTKVGGFTKNGVVQCVKLVEESVTEDTSRLEVVEETNSLFLPYFKYRIQIINSSDQVITIPSTYSEFSYISLLNSSGTQIQLSRNYSGGDNWNFSKNPSWTSGEVSIINLIVGGSIKDTVSKVKFIDEGSTQTQSSRNIIFTKNTNNSYYSNSSTPFIFKYDWILNIPTVRMCKNGMLKCKELVEEPAIDLTSTFGGVISGGGINLDNGYRLQFKSGSSWSSAVNKTTFPSNMYGLNITIQNSDYSSYAIWFSRSSSSVNRFTASFNNNSYEDRAPIIWADKSPIKMYFNQLSIFESSSGGYDRSYFPLNQTYLAMYNKNNELIFYYTFTGYDMDTIYGSWETPGNVPYSDRFKTPTVRVFKDGTIKCAEVQEATLRSKLNEFSGSSTLPPSSGVVTCTNGLKISIGAYSFPGSSGDAYTFVFRDENYRDFLKIIGKGASTTITSALDTSNASIWNQLSDITISEIKLDYLSTTTMPSSLVITWKGKSYTYSLYPSSTNPYSKLYRPSSSQVVLSVLDRVSFTWTS